MGFFVFVLIFIFLFWLCWVIVAAQGVFTEACGLFSCDMQTLSCGMQTLSCSMHAGSSSPTRDRTQAPCIGSAVSYPLDHQGSPLLGFLISPIFFFNFYYYLFIIYFWLCWVFVSVRGLSPVVASGGHSSSQCAGLSLPWPLLLWSTGSRRAGSVAVAHGPSCSAACGIFPD